MHNGIKAIIFICLVLASIKVSAQNKQNIEADIERAIKEFFFKVSEMNNPIEPIRPEDFASTYQRGINGFQINSGDVTMLGFLKWYKNNVLENYNISHHVRIYRIEPLQERNKYYVIGILERKLEDDMRRRRVKNEPIEATVIWRGNGNNNVSIQNISFNLKLEYLIPNIEKEYELSLDKIVSHLPNYGGRWEVEVTSNRRTMEGYDDEEKTCVLSTPTSVSYYNPDNIPITEKGMTLSGYIGPNKSKQARCFLIIFKQEESEKQVYHYIYQSGKRKR